MRNGGVQATIGRRRINKPTNKTGLAKLGLGVPSRSAKPQLGLWMGCSLLDITLLLCFPLPDGIGYPVRFVSFCLPATLRGKLRIISHRTHLCGIFSTVFA